MTMATVIVRQLNRTGQTTRAQDIYLLLTLACLGPISTLSRSLNLLMVGNSFSGDNQLEESIEAMLKERRLTLLADSISAERFDKGAANWEHYATSTGLTQALHERPWTWVILQEQSQTPGFYPPLTGWEKPAEELFTNSMDALLKLDAQIQQDHAVTILFATWGFFETDPMNPQLYTDYEAMQNRLTQGYQLYQEAIVDRDPNNARVRIAPVGEAYRRIFLNIKKQYRDPFEKGSLFDQLYLEVDEPRKHPSVVGSYLAACVLFETLTGLDVRQSSYSGPDGIVMDATMRQVIQQAAHDAVQEYNRQNPDRSKDILPNNGNSSNGLSPKPYVPPEDAGKGGNNAKGASSSSWGRRLMIFGILAGVTYAAAQFLLQRRRREGMRRNVVYMPADQGQSDTNSNDSWETVSQSLAMEMSSVQEQHGLS